jgi:hypothetical protein
MQIFVLYRKPDALGLYGIPYRMREGQSPRDLQKAHDDYVPPRPGHYGSKQTDLSDWVYLGHPGWWGDMGAGHPVRKAIVAFAAEHPDAIPRGPYEWVDLTALGLELHLPDAA